MASPASRTQAQAASPDIQLLEVGLRYIRWHIHCT